MKTRLVLSILALSSMHAINAMQPIDKAVLKAYVAENGLQNIQKELETTPEIAAEVSYRFPVFCEPTELPSQLSPEELNILQELAKFNPKGFTNQLTKKTTSWLTPASGAFYRFSTTFTQDDLNQLLREQQQ